MIGKTKRAFILIEFMFAVIIFILAFLIAIHIFVSLNQNYKVLTSYLTSYLKAREIIDFISKDCRNAVRIMDSFSGYITGDNCIVFKLPSIDASGDIIDVNNEFDYIAYIIEDSNLWKMVMPGPNSARQTSKNILKKDVDSIYAEFNGTPLSMVPHKSAITRLTLWVSISEYILGKEYKINPGTTVKLMNYEWEFVR